VNQPEWTHKHANQLRDHWWWRPGWHLGTRFLTWHLTFDAYDDLHRLIHTYQNSVRARPGIDLVPSRWLHLTMQGVGTVQDVPKHTLDHIVTATRERFAMLRPIEVRFHKPVVRPEAIALPPTPVEPVQRLRAAIREAMAQVLDHDGVPEAADGFQPHISLAYVSADQPAAPIIEQLNAVYAIPVQITVRTAALIELNRDNRMYEWRTVAAVPIGEGDPAAHS
jgi:2'-5' RNA ligase